MYLERQALKNPKGKTVYKYLVECPDCHQTRWQWKTNGGRCASCAAIHCYNPVSADRKDKRKHGQGYITKQGYHLLFDGNSYIPAHRFAFPNITKDMLVHHIDGNKLNNDIGNLIPLTKKAHRELHGQLERLSYFLIQNGFIQYDKQLGVYSLSSSMQKCMELISVNSVELLPGGAEDNTEPSPLWGRCNDYPIEEYAQVGGSAECLNT